MGSKFNDSDIVVSLLPLGRGVLAPLGEAHLVDGIAPAAIKPERGLVVWRGGERHLAETLLVEEIALGGIQQMHGDAEPAIGRMHQELLNVADRLLGVGIDLHRCQQQPDELFARAGSFMRDPEQALPGFQQYLAAAPALRRRRDEGHRRGAVGFAGAAHDDVALAGGCHLARSSRSATAALGPSIVYRTNAARIMLARPPRWIRPARA